MNPPARDVLSSQEHRPTDRPARGVAELHHPGRPGQEHPVTGFMSGPRVDGASRATRRLAGGAGVCSVLLGLLITAGLPALADAAFYVAVLAGALGLGAITTGGLLWARDTLVLRAGVAICVVPVLGGAALTVSLGLPGASELARLGLLGSSGALVLAVTAVALLVLDALRRTPEQKPDRPYAL